MYQNINLEALDALKERDPEAAAIIDTLLDNHTRIISKINHEIRNPLTLVYSSLQLIATKYPQTKDFKFWSSTVESVEFMKVLLEELTDFNNGSKLNLTRINTYDYLRVINFTYAMSVIQSQIRLSTTIPCTLPNIVGDKIKLQEVLNNLLRNAQESMDGPGKIFVSANHDTLNGANHLVISIQDKGCGIPPEHLESIFEMFKTYKTGGTGLGLAICREIAEAHGGSLSVTSILGEGSTFVLRLPVEQDGYEETHD